MEEIAIPSEVVSYARHFLARQPAPSHDDMRAAMRALLRAGQTLEPDTEAHWDPPSALAGLSIIGHAPGRQHTELSARPPSPEGYEFAFALMMAQTQVIGVCVIDEPLDENSPPDVDSLSPIRFAYTVPVEPHVEAVTWTFRRQGVYLLRAMRRLGGEDPWIGWLDQRFQPGDTLHVLPGARVEAFALADPTRAPKRLQLDHEHVQWLEPTVVRHETFPFETQDLQLVFSWLAAHLPDSGRFPSPDRDSRLPQV